MNNNKLKIVLDTNVFIVSLSSHFKYYWVYEKLQNNEYDLFITNEILTEYQEELSSRYGLKETGVTLDFLLLLPNVTLVTPYYRWQLIEQDADDNKFVDCAIASNVDYIVSNDKHFKVLKEIKFPKIEIITVQEFEKLLK